MFLCYIHQKEILKRANLPSKRKSDSFLRWAGRSPRPTFSAQSCHEQAAEQQMLRRAEPRAFLPPRTQQKQRRRDSAFKAVLRHSPHDCALSFLRCRSVNPESQPCSGTQKPPTGARTKQGSQGKSAFLTTALHRFTCSFPN